MIITLLKTEKNFRIKYTISGKSYVFMVKMTYLMNQSGIDRVTDIKRMRHHQNDCHEVLKKKDLVRIKEEINERLERK